MPYGPKTMDVTATCVVFARRRGQASETDPELVQKVDAYVNAPDQQAILDLALAGEIQGPNDDEDGAIRSGAINAAFIRGYSQLPADPMDSRQLPGIRKVWDLAQWVYENSV